MSETHKPDDGSEGLSDEDLRRLDSWTAPAPPADFTARVLSRARTERSPGPSPHGDSAGHGQPTMSRPPMSRGERERRQRRRALLATALGALALSGGGGFIAWQGAAAAAPSTVGAMAIYLAALAFGGVLLVASLVGHHDHTDHHAGDLEQAHAHGHHVGTPSHATALVLPFLSLRFWIFGLAFFGLTGVVLLGLHLTSPIVAAALATAIGLGFGYSAAWLFQTLARETVGQLAPDGGHVGREGKLLLPVVRGQRGMVRVATAGAITDLLAETDDERPIPAGTTVLVVAMRETVALVERSPTPSSSTAEGDPT
jgi:membrane protein implicated in regulation of membrane protease activity